KEEQLLNLAYNSVRKRVADALILLSQKEDNKSFQVLREDLARIVGTAKESVIRMLTEFKNDGYIDITEGTIIILDIKKLTNLPS
ncbi:MAG: Crp/Fnr family transcriptional regulator, partial [Bacteroidota bacterium]